MSCVLASWKWDSGFYWDSWCGYILCTDKCTNWWIFIKWICPGKQRQERGALQHSTLLSRFCASAPSLSPVPPGGHGRPWSSKPSEQFSSRLFLPCGGFWFEYNLQPDPDFCLCFCFLTYSFILASFISLAFKPVHNLVLLHPPRPPPGSSLHCEGKKYFTDLGNIFHKFL